MRSYENAVIVAGGKSSRMGKDKSLLPFGMFKSLTQFQYTKLQQFFSNVYISTKENKFDFEAALIYDKYEDSSPLVALLSIFETLNVESVFLLAVDTPFIDEKVIEHIYKQETKECDVVIAKSPSGEHPLCGIYKKSILSTLQKQYEKGNHRLHDLLREVNTIKVAFSDDTPFANLNHPNEYTDAFRTYLIRTSS